MIPDSTHIFDVVRLTKTLQSAGDTVSVIRDVSFSVNKGEFVVLHGSHGSGKSILFYSLLGLEPPTTGTVYMEGVDMYALSEPERAVLRRKKIGIIYRNPLWIHSLDVLQNIEFSIHLSDPCAYDVQERAVSILKQMGVEKWMHHRPSDLNGETQIIISIGRALASSPSIIMGDDITKHLEPDAGHSVMNALSSLNKRGTTVTIVTSNDHYRGFANRSIRLEDGHNAEDIMSASLYL